MIRESSDASAELRDRTGTGDLGRAGGSGVSGLLLQDRVGSLWQEHSTVALEIYCIHMGLFKTSFSMFTDNAFNTDIATAFRSLV